MKEFTLTPEEFPEVHAVDKKTWRYRRSVLYYAFHLTLEHTFQKPPRDWWVLLLLTPCLAEFAAMTSLALEDQPSIMDRNILNRRLKAWAARQKDEIDRLRSAATKT